jgi:NAD(P)-dependent dehydrogenase (short-subunit alcohol dehydrogenase family)
MIDAPDNPDEPYRGRIALVTGANRGIGLAIAIELANRGSHVIVGSRHLADATATATDITASGGSAEPVVIDITDDGSVASAGATVEDIHGYLDILVNNAGIKLDHHPLAPSTAPIEQVRETLDTNVLGPIRVTQSMLPMLVKSNRPRIVNVSSGLASLTLANVPGHRYQSRPLLAYHTSKTALNMATVLFANEFRDTPLRINAIDPGSTNTRLTQGRSTREPEEAMRPVFDVLEMPNDGPTGAFFGADGETPW